MRNDIEKRFRNISKLICIFAAAIVLIFFAGSCGKAGENIGDGSSGDGSQGTVEKMQVVTTVFPLYDWTRAIIGDDPDFQVTLLADSGVDFHSFQPSTEDIMKIEKSDLFFYIGGASEQWVRKVAEEQRNHGGESLSMVDVLGEMVKQEDDDDGDIDEHLWLSLKNAKVFVENIAQTLSEHYPQKKDTFEKNADAYIQNLNELDKQYKEAVDSGAYKSVVVGDRFPFRYLFDDYGLTYFAAFPGCSSESEGSFEKIIWLAKKVDQLNIKEIIQIEGSKQTICDSIIENTEKKNQTVVIMDSMQQVSMKDIEEGESYLKIMEENLIALKEALN